MKILTQKGFSPFQTPKFKRIKMKSNEMGSALLIVLIFSIITFITVSVYVMSQFNFARVLRKEPAKLQALLNARSGIWYGLAMLDKEVGAMQSDSGSSDTSSSDLFGEDMFEHEEKEKEEDEPSLDEMQVLSEGESETIALFDSTILFTYLIKPSAFFQILESEGMFRDYSKNASVVIGSKPFISPDTVLYLSTLGLPEGTGHFDGKVAFIAENIDSSDSLQRKRFFINRDKLVGIVEEHIGPLFAVAESLALNPPLTIQYNEDFSEIPDTVLGPLFIDGSSRDLFWRAERQIYVVEELQITGSVHLENMKFIVKGDIKILDEAKLKSVELFSGSRIFFAGESDFNGNAMAYADIEIYEQAAIKGKSIIISAGLSKREEKKEQQEEQEVDKKVKKGSSKKKPEIKPFSAFVRDQAIVDGVLIDLRRLGGISTDEETVIRGILWAEGRVCHKGRMKGVIKSSVLVDESEPLKVISNSLAGTIDRLNTIGEYYLPYFIGQPVIKEWKEE